MTLDKLNRARCILGCVMALVRRDYGARAETYKIDDLHAVSVPGVWSATITRRCSSAEAAGSNVPRERWDFMHVHVGNDLVLAMRFHGENTELIRFHPGPWERWFGTLDLSDMTPFPPANDGK